MLYKADWPVGVPAIVRGGADGSRYWLAQGVLYRWDIAANELAPLATAVDARFATEPTPGTWRFATATSVLKARLN